MKTVNHRAAREWLHKSLPSHAEHWVNGTDTRVVKTTSAYNPNGVVIYDGPSKLDGQPIIVVMTGLANSSANAKTGGLLQTYILLRDASPIEGVASGADVSICGDCPHRPGPNGRSCYVNLGQGPLSVWRCYQRGRYQAVAPAEAGRMAAGRRIRLGAYGDPAAVPTAVWRDLTAEADRYTGYTHQWRDCDDSLAEYCMASADSPDDYREAQAAGWRTFRVRTANQPKLKGEGICPASAEAGKRLTCADCMQCDGTARQGTVRRLNNGLAIIVHGLSHQVAAFERKAAA